MPVDFDEVIRGGGLRRRFLVVGAGFRSRRCMRRCRRRCTSAAASTPSSALTGSTSPSSRDLAAQCARRRAPRRRWRSCRSRRRGSQCRRRSARLRRRASRSTVPSFIDRPHLGIDDRRDARHHADPPCHGRAHGFDDLRGARDVEIFEHRRERHRRMRRR